MLKRILLTATVALIGGCGAAAGTGTILGNWKIYDGMNETTEDWSITEQNGQPVLTSAAGSVIGTAAANGATFHWEGQNQTLLNMGVNNILQIDIACYISADGSMYGTKVFTQYVANGLGVMDPIPSTESWEFVAVAQ